MQVNGTNTTRSRKMQGTERQRQRSPRGGSQAITRWRSRSRRRRQPLVRLALPGGLAAGGPSDETLAVEDLEYAGHAPHLALEVPRVVGQAGGGAAHPRGRHRLPVRACASASPICRCRPPITRHGTACALRGDRRLSFGVRRRRPT